MEVLVVGKQQVFAAAVFQGRGKDLSAQILQGDIGDSRHTLRGAHVTGGAGGGLEHNRVGDDSCCHHAGHLFAGHQTSVLEHGSDDGIGRAYGLVADVNGVAGLNISQAVVVDDLQDLRFFQTGNGLGSFVVVNQYHPLSSGTQQMVTGQNANDLLFFVQDGVAVFAELQHLLLNLIHTVFQVEANQILGTADTADGCGLEQQTGCAVSVIGGGDDAGLGGEALQLLVQLRLTQHQAVDVHFQSSADHIGLMAADYDGILLVEQKVIPALGQGDGDLTGDHVGVFTGLVEYLALQGGQDVKQRNPI